MDTLLAHCSTLFSQHGGLFAIFFLGGLTGSVTHCLAMCGPVVACHAACARGCSKQSVASPLWSYHVGRAAIYGALGFTAALLSRQIAELSAWPVVSSVMLVLAGTMFIASSLPSCHNSVLKISSRSNFLRGLLMGFMPCGLLYAALMMAATFADPWGGMIAMWLFALGTMPVLLIASIGTGMVAQRWQNGMDRAGRAMMACNGLALLVMAAKIVR